MFAPIAALVIILVTFAASLNAQLGASGPHYASDDNVAWIDDNSSHDNSEQKTRTLAQTDKGSVKKTLKKNDDVCVGNCSDAWRPYQLTPWPINELRQSI